MFLTKGQYSWKNCIPSKKNIPVSLKKGDLCIIWSPTIILIMIIVFYMTIIAEILLNKIYKLN